MEAICVKVEARYPEYMDFVVSVDEQSLYRYEAATGKMKKLFGFDNYGKAVRGKMRKTVESLAKTAFENGLPFAIAM